MHSQITLPVEFTIGSIAALQPAWLALLGPDRASPAGRVDAAFQVDAAAVVEVDAAGVQLLLALAHALARRRRVLQLDNPSAALTSACAALGVAHLLAAAALTEAIA